MLKIRTMKWKTNLTCYLSKTMKTLKSKYLFWGVQPFRHCYCLFAFLFLFLLSFFCLSLYSHSFPPSFFCNFLSFFLSPSCYFSIYAQFVSDSFFNNKLSFSRFFFPSWLTHGWFAKLSLFLWNTFRLKYSWKKPIIQNVSNQ